MADSPKVRGGKGPMLAAAARNFTQFGYHGTSIRDIARDADVTPASIYHHFASKQELLREIMIRAMSDVISETRVALMGAGEEPAAQLSALVRAWILFHTQRQTDAMIGASELRSLDDLGYQIVVALRDEQERMFRDVITRGVSLGEFATPYPLEAARAVINMGYSVASWYKADGSVAPEEMAERYVELALGAVRAGQ